MNIQDIRYISAVAEAGSINKAADRLLVTQPSLSKCVQKIEREYGVTLFTRTRGSSTELTAEGELFLRMAREVLLAHDGFMDALRQRRQQEQNRIVFGTTSQGAFKIAETLCKKVYEKEPDYFVVVQVKDSTSLRRGIRDGSLDMALLSQVEWDEPGFHSVPLYTCRMGVLLRTGSPAAQKAKRAKGQPYPVLSLEELAGEPFAANLPGSGSRNHLEKVLEKAGISLPLIELPNFQNRLAMVKNGQANLLLQLGNRLGYAEQEMPGQLYCLPPEQSVLVSTCLVCQAGRQRSAKFRIVYQCLEEILS